MLAPAPSTTSAVPHGTRSLAYDGCQLMRAAPAARDVALARWLVDAHCPGACAVVAGSRAVEALALPRLRERLHELDRRGPTPEAGLTAVRDWLLGSETVRTTEALAPEAETSSWARLATRLPWRAGTAVPAHVPEGAVLLKADLSGWENPALHHWLQRRGDLVPVAFADEIWALDFPEYAAPEEAAVLRRRLSGLARYAKLVIVPNATTRNRLVAWMRAEGHAVPPIDIQAQPSRLATAKSMNAEPALAEVPYLLVAGPLDARRNTPMLLNTWRALIHAGERVPKLVLAGPRGAQIEDAKPLLDWGETIRPHVREVPELTPEGLRHLATHARAILSPAFAKGTAALLRDALALGLPILASDIPVHRETLRGAVSLIAPIDGRGWRAAVLSAAESAAPSPPIASLPGWDRYWDDILRVVAAL